MLALGGGARRELFDAALIALDHGARPLLCCGGSDGHDRVITNRLICRRLCWPEVDHRQLRPPLRVSSGGRSGWRTRRFARAGLQSVESLTQRHVGRAQVGHLMTELIDLLLGAIMAPGTCGQHTRRHDREPREAGTLACR